MIGRTLGHYLIIEKIGAGGMGEVYRAHDEQLDRDVALKVLPVGTLTDEVTRRRFRKEALALAKLNHPNIAAVYEFGSQDGVDYLVMEYIPGATLAERLAAGALPEREVLTLGAQIAVALEEAHDQGVVHRDLKPGNIVVTPRGQVKVLDFGLAKLLRPASDLSTTDVLSSTAAMAGTLPYMSPEQLRGKPVDVRSDTYAAGAVLYEMATGRRPFQDNVATALADDILHTPPPPPGRLKHDLSPRLEQIILKCLEKDPANRYQSAKELVVDLRRLAMPSSATAAALPARAPSTWRRAARPVAYGAAGLLVLVALLAGLNVGGLFYSRRAHALTEKDTVVLADFTNSTGDAVFDDTLRQGLAVQLEQSPFLSLISEEHVQQTLRLMGQPADARLTPEIAREICQRTGSAAVLSGSIASLGSQYVLGLKAVSCRTGDSLAQEQATADGKERVLKAVGEAAAKLRSKLGESLSTVAKFDTPLEQATTPSLEALKAFTLGLKVRRDKGDETQVMLLSRRAIELDPNFAMAYGVLGTAYSNLGKEDLAIENIQKAYELRDRASEREKYRITVYYYAICTGELEKLLETSEQWVLAYPRDYLPHGFLAAALANLGRHERAAEEYRESLRLEPNVVIYDNLIPTQLTLGRLDQAEATLREAEQRKPDWPGSHFLRYNLAFLRGDAVGMQWEVAWSVNNPQQGTFMLFLQAQVEAFSGHLGRARELTRRRVEQARRASQPELVMHLQIFEAQWEAEFGNPDRARQQTLAVLPATPATRLQLVAALTLARAGDATRAQAVAERVSKRFPRHTMINGYWLPTIRAAIEIQRQNPARAIELLQAALPYELVDPELGSALYSAYLRGEAYLLLRRGAEASVEFQKFLDHRGLVGAEPLGGLAHLGVARAWAVAGDPVQSRRAYQDFFALWKDADPDIPILQQAKAEYAKLK